MPQIRPFRALRYVPDQVGDLGAVVAPPYDVLVRPIGRDLPRVIPGTSFASMPRPTSRATPRTIATGAPRGPSRRGAPTGRSTRIPGRRSTSTSRPIGVPGTDVERTQRGFFARLRLEPLEAGSGVLPARADARRRRARIATACSARPA